MKSLNVIFPAKEKIEIWEEEIGSPGPGEVLCAAEKSLISTGTEMQCLKGVFDEGTNWDDWVKYPFNPGYSMGARVIAVGKDVTTFKIGDRVISIAPHSQYFKTNPEALYPIPDGISYEDAAWVQLSLTAQQGVRRAELKLGETVGVIGLGMLGLLAIQYLKVLGARKIIAIDPVQMRLDMAKKCGATHLISEDLKNAKNTIKDITNGDMLDVVFDITGHPAVLSQAIPLVRKLGRVILLGDTATPSKQCLGPGVVSNSVSILGIHMALFPEKATEFNMWTKENMTALFFDYILQGRMNSDLLITHRYSPLDAPKVYEGLLKDRSTSIGNIFDWSLLK